MLGFMNVNYEIGDRTIHKQQDRDRAFKQDRKRRSLIKKDNGQLTRIRKDFCSLDFGISR